MSSVVTRCHCRIRFMLTVMTCPCFGGAEKSKELLEEVEFMSIRAKRAQEDSQAAVSC